MRVPTTLAILTLAVSVSFAPSCRQARAGGVAAIANTVDAIAAEALNSGQVPGLEVAVGRDHRLLFAQGYGLASAEPAVPMEANSRLRIGSSPSWPMKKRQMWSAARIACRGRSLEDVEAGSCNGGRIASVVPEVTPAIPQTHTGRALPANRVAAAAYWGASSEAPKRAGNAHIRALLALRPNISPVFHRTAAKILKR